MALLAWARGWRWGLTGASLEWDIPYPMGCSPPGMRAVGKELPTAPQWVLPGILGGLGGGRE